jgi:tRNA G46 methylase TrmB
MRSPVPAGLRSFLHLLPDGVAYTVHMFANSAPVSSNQQIIHPRLHEIVNRHFSHPFLKPVSTCNRIAFEAAVDAWRIFGASPLILDAGCGVGLSTLHLAAQYPDHFVMGIDQSAHRLARRAGGKESLPRNCILMRADLADFWRLLQAHGASAARQYLLYPNPWPKAAQVQRRWHAHPAFPSVVALGGIFECRSNWRLYAEECAAALALAGAQRIECGPYSPRAPITPFERKYLASGHALWRCSADLSATAQPGPQTADTKSAISFSF